MGAITSPLPHPAAPGREGGIWLIGAMVPDLPSRQRSAMSLLAGSDAIFFLSACFSPFERPIAFANPQLSSDQFNRKAITQKTIWG